MPPRITIDGQTVSVKTPEGRIETTSVDALLRHVQDLCAYPGWASIALPPGTRHLQVEDQMAVLALERPPSVAAIDWIRRDSPRPFGSAATYTKRVIGLPYLVAFTLWAVREGRWELTKRSELFFAKAPLTSLSTPLYFPHLLNCSRYKWEKAEDPSHPIVPGRNLSWFCTQNLGDEDLYFNTAPDMGMRVHRTVNALWSHFIGGSFNYSSEHQPHTPGEPYEACSWYTEGLKTERRLPHIEAWEQKSAADPLFVLEAPWLPVPLTPFQIVTRLFAEFNAHRPPPQSARDLERLIMSGDSRNHQPLYPHNIWGAWST